MTQLKHHQFNVYSQVRNNRSFTRRSLWNLFHRGHLSKTGLKMAMRKRWSEGWR
jgi:hypothetical protein